MIIPPSYRYNENVFREDLAKSCSTSLLRWTWHVLRCNHLDRAFRLCSRSKSCGLHSAVLQTLISRLRTSLKTAIHQRSPLLTRDNDGPPHVPGDLSQNTQNGIIIGSVFGILIVVFALFFWGQRKNIQLVLSVSQNQVVELEGPPEREDGPGDQPNPPDVPAPPGDGPNVEGGDNDAPQNRDDPAPEQDDDAGQEIVPAGPAEPAEHRADDVVPPTIDPDTEAAPLAIQAIAPVGDHEERVAASAARALARAARLEDRLAKDSSSSEDDEHSDRPRLPRKHKRRSRRRARFARQVEIIQKRDEDE